MKIVIVGGVAAGTKAAAKLKRENPNAEVVIYTKGKNISYAGCGLPYYIGGSIEKKEELIVNTPEKFMGLTRTIVYTESEVTNVDAEKKTITVNDEEVSYDKLILAVGAYPVIPGVKGTDLKGVFTVRTVEDAIGVREYAENNSVKRAVVIGGGFIGLEVAENLKSRGVNVTVADMANQLMPGIFDPEMADYIRRTLQKNGMRIMTGCALKEIHGEANVTGVETDGGNIPADMVILAVGIRPATQFLVSSGIEMERGLIVTDDQMNTSVKNICAVGDCAIVKNRVTGSRQWSAMGSTANIAGRCLAMNLSGTESAYPGCLGTAVVKLDEQLNAAKTGLTEKQAADAGFSVITAVSVVDAKAHYYPDSSAFIVKMIADQESRRLLGMQVIGAGAVDKMADIAVVGISLNARIDDFITMDFAYAPPFSTAIHPFAAACTVLLNKLTGGLVSFTPAEYASGAANGYRLIDAMPAPTLPGAKWLNLSNIENEIREFSKDEKLLLVCARGKRGYLMQKRLRALGYVNTRVLEGGASVSVIREPRSEGGKLTPDQIKRVKGLGCLQDKRFDDVFNVRVITRNGKITALEHRAIAEAAERFGSSEAAMTSRLTIEIQGVKYDNIEPLIEFLKGYGLETGGTGSLVRPIVSCKGTTCQYGLADTFGLSEKLHERFYVGYHKVTLPHKFKIGVGGCPNNCVKPNLNDLGIIGQRVPMFNLSKCRGCKTCQVVNTCPIKIASLQDGKLHIDTDACNNCGRCKGKCPFGVTEEYVNGYKVYIGGRWGKNVAHGKALSKIFLSDEEVMDVVERAILFFRDEGISGERFADTVNRLGFEYVENKLLNGEIAKDEIMNKTVKGGATC
ncbi:MAG: FAD-dependent oxidoreductase [Clostridia bacterium]|nr:FAD-dependent oxidoreductase [Clostridia bacterium]